MSAGVFAGRVLPSDRRQVAKARTLFEAEGLVVTAVAVWALMLALWLPALVAPDTWLALVDGRLVATHGIPHSDPFGAWTLGRAWTDQQWGAHLALYELARHVGVWAVVAFGAVAVIGALSIAAVLARKLGATARSVAMVLLFPVIAAPWMAQARTQSFAVLLFPVVYGLLALDARSPSRRVLWVIPTLAIWANLHGSVVLAAALAIGHGALTAARTRNLRTRGVTLAVGSLGAVMASPYAFDLPGYYRLMLVHPPFASAVTEWGPASFSKLSAVYFFTAFAAVALGVSQRRALTTFERWALPLLLVASLSAMRNAIWFELALAISVPRLLDRAWPSTSQLTPPAQHVNRRLGFAMVVAAAAVAVVQLMALPSHLTSRFPPDAARAVARAAGPDGTVLADDKHSDWLLWEQPVLAGRIAYDVRFELFGAHEMTQIPLLRDDARSVWQRCGRTASVVTFASADALRRARQDGILNEPTRVASAPGFEAVRQRAASTRCAL